MPSSRTPLDRGAAVTGVVTVVAANFLYLAGLRRILDPMMSMDPFYIQMAQGSVSGILSGEPAWGPLYALWLKPLVAAFSDPVAVYTANLYALSLGVSLLIYLHLLVLTRRAAVAVGAAFFFLISDFNVPLSSKVSGFALMVVLAGLTVSQLVPAGARRMSVAAAGVLLASYARPELYPAAVCLCLVALWLVYRGPETVGWRKWIWPATVLACIVISAVWIGTPVFSPSRGGDRFLIAFREHFAWNWSRWHREWRYFLAIWEQEFGDAQTVHQALVNNPAAVAHHLGDNLFGTMRFMVGAAFHHYPLVAPATEATMVTIENLVTSVALLGSLTFVSSRAVLRRQLFDCYGDVLLQYASVAISSLAAAMVIFPVAHYLVIPGVLLILAGTLAATLIIPTPTVSTWRARAFGVLLCLAAVPKPFVLPSAYEVAGSPFKGRISVARTVTDTIEFVRSLKLPPPVHVLTITDGIGEMLGPGFHEVKVWQKGAQPLEAYMRDNDIAMIINLEGGQDSFTVDDPYWKLVQNDPQAAGFTCFSVPEHETVHIWVRTELVQLPGDAAVREREP
jgi:hypothetical protein